MAARQSRREFLKTMGILSAATAIGPLPRPFLIQPARTLTIGINAWIATLDVHPAIGPNLIGSRLYGLFHDTLVQNDPVDGSLQPMLATEWENDGLEWRFKLREGVVFHDGSVMTADDVVYSFGRLLDPANESAFSANMKRFIARVEETDDLEVTFTSVNTDPLLPFRLTSYWTSIIPRAGSEALGAEALMTRPIGAGPYKVVEFRADDRMVLDRHSEYWEGMPAASQVIVRYIPEPSTRIGALQTGEVDLITQVPADQITILDAAAGVNAVSTRVQGYILNLFNTVKGPTADVNVRRAMTLAIDRDLIVDELWSGRSRAMTDFLLPTTFGFDPERSFIRYDPDAARAALEASSYAGEPINFQFTGGYYANDALVSSAIDQMWREIGLNINLDPMETAGYLDLYFAGEVMTNLQSFGSEADAQFFFENWASEGLFTTYYRPSAEFDELILRASQSLDQSQRYADFRRIVEIFENDLPLSPLYQNVDIFGVRDGVTWHPRLDSLIDLRPHNFSL